MHIYYFRIIIKFGKIVGCQWRERERFMVKKKQTIQSNKEYARKEKINQTSINNH